MRLARGREERTRAQPWSGRLTEMWQTPRDHRTHCSPTVWEWCPATAVPVHCHRVHLLHGLVARPCAAPTSCTWAGSSTAGGRSQRTECQEGARTSHSPARGESTVGTHSPAKPQSSPSLLHCPRSRRGAVSQQRCAEAPRASEPSTAGDLRHGTRTKRKPINYTCADCIWRTVLRLSDTKSLDPPARPSAYALRCGQV